MGEDSAQPRRWYYELVVDHVDPFLTPEPTHLRVGWAFTEGYLPRPTGGDAWGGNGVGDDLCSFGFDGLHLWSGVVMKDVLINNKEQGNLYQFDCKFIVLCQVA